MSSHCLYIVFSRLCIVFTCLNIVKTFKFNLTNFKMAEIKKNSSHGQNSVQQFQNFFDFISSRSKIGVSGRGELQEVSSRVRL